MKRRTFLGAMTLPLIVGLLDAPARAGADTARPGAATAGGGPTRPSFAVAPHRGAPTLFVDGHPRFPMYLFEEEVSAHDGQVFTRAQVEFYSFIEKGVYLDLGWTGPGQQDFTVIDRVLQTFDSRVPSGYALPRIHLWAPSWWLDSHPSDVLSYAIPGSGLDRDASFASAVWRAEAGDRLRAMVRHILDGPQGHRVMGITLAAGLFGEWLYFNADHLPDTTPAMRTAWISHLRAKYGNSVSALRAAWGDPAATFDDVVIPSAADRRSTVSGLFRDPVAGQRVIDYYEAFHEVVATAIDHFASIVKDESGGALLTSVLYGYTPDQGYLPQEQHHRAAAKLHRLASIDMITSPHSYYRRAPGDDGGLRTYTESVTAHGKLFIDESDDRTHLAPAGTSFVYATTMAESIGIVRRAFGQALTHGTGMWYMDQSSGLWYDDPAFAKEFTALKRWGDYSLNVPRGRSSQVAVISVEEAEFSLAGETDTTAKLYEGPTLTSRQGFGELAKAGAPFDRYLIEDLVDGKVPDRYKVYVFPDAFRLTTAQRQAVDALKGAGRTLVWGWAPGYAGADGLSASRVAQLTGFTLDEHTAPPQSPPDPAHPVHVQDFESGSFGPAYSAGAGGSSGVLTTVPGEVVAGTRSAKGSAPSTTDWFEFLYTVPSVLPLEARARYRVTFRCRTLTAPGSGAYFYFVARTATGGVPRDVGSQQWTDGASGVYEKSFDLTIGDFPDYHLIWGVHGGGAIAIDDITIVKTANAGLAPVSYRLTAASFPGDANVYGGEIALEPLFIPTDTDMTVLARSTDSAQLPVIASRQLSGWRSVLASTPPLPAAVLRKVYRDAGVWVYLDSGDNIEVNDAWISVHAAGAGTKTIALPAPGPIHNASADMPVGAAVSSVSLTMAKGETVLLARSLPNTNGVRFDFESPQWAGSHFTPGFGGAYGTLTTDPAQVVAGTRSAYGTAPASTDWYEFLYSDPADIVLAPGASYEVSFSSRTSASPGAGGYHYFLARSQGTGATADVGVTSWTGAVGAVERRTVQFTTQNHGDYRLVWGLRLGGGLAVDDVTVTRTA